ncbi:MAG: acyl-coenzyme A thioesterase PaaI-like protein [Crocinitomicaceae bacterium]|jgi:acyl-coenzyme A thioesterase PaaI-like protein
MSKPAKEVTLKKMKWMLFLLGLMKIPIIGFIKPRLIELNDDNASVKIRLRRRTKNHLKSMYFGALAVGADVSAGLHAFYFAGQMGKKVSFAFKGMQAEFLMRAESDVVFSSVDGQVVKAAIQESSDTDARVNKSINVTATNKEGEIVATFVMIISVRVK